MAHPAPRPRASADPAHAHALLLDSGELRVWADGGALAIVLSDLDLATLVAAGGHALQRRLGPAVPLRPEDPTPDTEEPVMTLRSGGVAALLAGLVEREGRRYTNRPADAGGPTKFGITQRALSDWRGRPVTAAEVEALQEAEALEIYEARYVRAPGFAEVLEISPLIGEELVDTGVNCGPGRASEYLQRLLNALNREGRDYPDIKVDGDVGPATRAALRAYLAHRGAEGEAVLWKALNCLQGAHYVGLAERRAHDEQNLYGWLRSRIELDAAAQRAAGE